MATGALLAVSVFWAMNMGASGLAVSFSPGIGAGLLRRTSATLLFSVFVLLGAVLLGERVAATLKGKVIPQELITTTTATFILGGAAFSLLLANRVGIPQSTSIIIVFSLVGAGLFFGRVSWSVLGRLVFLWLLLSTLSYIVTYLLARRLYPPRDDNFALHEKLHRHRERLGAFTILTSCYGAFGIGTNNVANVVGPLAAAGVVAPLTGLILFAPLFGLGGWLLGGRVVDTVSHGVVPIGIISSSILSLVCATFLIVASLLGAPAPYVQVTSMALLAVQSAKEELSHGSLLKRPISRRILAVWTLTPTLAASLTFALLWVVRFFWPQALPAAGGAVS